MTAVARLIAATPYPPATDDVGELIVAGVAVMAARQAVIDALAAEPADPAELAELTARQDAWAACLAAARVRLGGQRAGVRGLRAYGARPR
ncbi:MAG TPA: hypothetical protein VLX92_14735 [Kofleriaceae bacterium]|nr:hypothetical protein [Kofleriaceae bacterium]